MGIGRVAWLEGILIGDGFDKVGGIGLVIDGGISAGVVSAVSMTDVIIVGAIEVSELLMIGGGDFMSMSIIDERVVDDDVI